MSNKATAGLQQRIEQLQARAEKLRTIQAMIPEDPELATELLNVLVTPPAEDGVTPAQPRLFRSTGQRDSEAPQLDKVVSFFLANNNDLATVRVICEATGLTRGSVNALLYTSKHKQNFVWVQEGPKRKLWRLRDEMDGNVEGHEVELQDGDQADVTEDEMDDE